MYWHISVAILEAQMEEEAEPLLSCTFEQSKHVTLNVLLGAAFRMTRVCQLLSLTLTAPPTTLESTNSVRKSWPLVVRRASPAYFGGAVGAQSIPVEGGGGGGGGGGCAQLDDRIANSTALSAKSCMTETSVASSAELGSTCMALLQSSTAPNMFCLRRFS